MFLPFDMHFVKRRLRDKDAALFKQLRHLPEEESQQQGADMRPVHIGIRHQDNLSIATFG